MLALSVFLDLIDNKSDEEYFTWFYNKYRDLAKYVALPIVKDEFRAEDAMQDAFLYLAKNVHKITKFEETSARNYAMAIVRGAAFNIVRRKEYFSEIPMQFTTLSEEEEWEQLQSFRDNEIRQAVETLEPLDQQLVLFRYTYQHNSKEIGNMLHIKSTKVRKRLQFIRAKLKEELSDKEEVASYE